MLKLYTYFRSSAAYRVRIALNLKKLEYTAIPVHLMRDGGHQHRSDYAALNPQELLPTLEDDGLTITQSLAILEYLEEVYPSPALLPADAPGRAYVRSLALAIASDIHPLNNLRVLCYLQDTLGVDAERRAQWYRQWVKVGFTALENLLARRTPAGEFCHGDSPTLADCCLIPQVFNAQRMQCPLDNYPALMHIHANCEDLEAFQRAAPGMQFDAE